MPGNGCVVIVQNGLNVGANRITVEIIADEMKTICLLGGLDR